MNKILSTFCVSLLLFSCTPKQNKSSLGDNNFKSVSFQNLSETKAYFNWSYPAKKLVSAHRGGPYPNYPENCIATFEHVLSQTPAIIECDIAVAKDGTLVMMHDDKLDRTTNGKGFVKDFTIGELKKLALKDNNGKLTEHHIPTLEEVLEWTKQKAFLTLDVKRGVSYEKVNSLVKKTSSEPYVAIIAYSIEAAKKIHRINPKLMISIPGRNMEDVQRIKNSKIAIENLIAFTGVTEPKAEVYQSLHEMGIYCILGSLGNLDRRAQARGDQFYTTLFDRGADILATDRPLEVANQLAQ